MTSEVSDLKASQPRSFAGGGDSSIVVVHPLSYALPIGSLVALREDTYRAAKRRNDPLLRHHIDRFDAVIDQLQTRNQVLARLGADLKVQGDELVTMSDRLSGLGEWLKARGDWLRSVGEGLTRMAGVEDWSPTSGRAEPETLRADVSTAEVGAFR